MLFPYKYVPNRMEKMQAFIGFIFDEVWCKAPSAEYGIHLFQSRADLYKVMEELSKLDAADKLKEGSGKFFYESLNEIFNEFKGLSEAEITEYKQRFAVNNKIEELCSGAAEVVPVTYSALNPVRSQLNQKIEAFFKNLYTSGFFNLKIVRESIGATLDEYYRSFVQTNSDGVCPFCGLMSLDGKFDPTREAFDHYLPKSRYPFNSVNLKNLAPSCNKCNSGNKKDQDPLHTQDGKRRKAFYPFATTSSAIKVKVSIEPRRWNSLTPEVVSVILTAVSQSEELETWKELFRIEQRYVSKCCKEDGGIAWLNRVLSEHENYKLSPREMLDAEIKSAAIGPWRDSNFLKKAFLEGCDHAGLFGGPEASG